MSRQFQWQLGRIIIIIIIIIIIVQFHSLSRLPAPLISSLWNFVLSSELRQFRRARHVDRRKVL